MSNYVYPEEIYSPPYESCYYKYSTFPLMTFNNEIENENNSLYEQKQNKDKDFELCFKKEFDSEILNIEKSNGVETQIKDSQKKTYNLLNISKAELTLAKTKCSSTKLNLLNNKRKKDDVENEDNIKEKQIDEKEKEDEEREKWYEQYYTNFKKTKGKKTKGRKKKGDLAESEHDKYSEDNIIRKIKSYFIRFINEILNKSVKNKNYEFLKLDSKISENLKKDFNLQLLDATIKDIYNNSKISTKYRRQIKDSSDKNKFLIKIIFEEKREIETINILNLTFRELFDIFRRKIKNIDDIELKMKIAEIPLFSTKLNDIENFFDEVRSKEIDKNEKVEVINEYLNKINKLCIYYEEWFLIKKGRNRK